MENYCNFKPFDKVLEFAKPRQKPEAVEYNKCFYNEGTWSTYSTFRKARLANPEARVCRCWKLCDEIKCMTTIMTCGEQVCTISNADKRISDAIKNGTVGVGFRDKRMC